MTAPDNNYNQLKQIKDEVLNLTQSPLFQYRIENNYLPVIGEGSLDAQILFIGEAPGKNEAMSGKPFCGVAGKILDKVLVEAGLKREEVYITNIVKDRPPENRDPSDEEIELYAPFLDKQIEIIKPKLVVTLGRISMAYIMKRYGLASSIKTIGEIHGQIFSAKSPNGFSFQYIPLHHPAATIYNKQSRQDLYDDMKKVAEIVPLKFDKHKKLE